MVKPLSVDNPAWNKLKQKVVPVFYINGRHRAFTWENMPRHKRPIGIVELAEYSVGSQTASEIVATINSILANGEKINIKMGTRPPEKVAHLTPEEIEKLEQPKPMKQILVKDWDRKKPKENLNKAEIRSICFPNQD
jgi:hypothetical protein